MLDQIFQSVYTRGMIAFILSIILAFSDQIEILKQPVVLVAIGILTFAMIAFDIVNDLGLMMLMCCLFVIVYNIQTFQRV